MEAEVLNPQMMADVNGNNKISNAELEVVKLQELVRKLEKQNEQLRTRANAVNNCSIGPHLQTSLSCLHGGTACSSDNLSCKYGIPSPTQSHPCALGSPEEPIAYFQPSSVSPDAAEEDSLAPGATVLDEVDILDLNTVLPIGEPESWLYVIPKSRLQGESVLSPLQWCRQVLDHLGPEVQLAKMTLLHRLDQVPSSAQSLLQSTLPFRASCNLSDRAPTFLSNSNLHNVGRRHAAISPQSSVDSEVGVSELEDDSISMSYKLQDMTDVEVMARLQEESLRQDYASTSHPPTASRRNSGFTLHTLRRSEMDLEEEEEDDEDEGYDLLPPPQPRLFRTGSMQRGGLPHSHTFSSIRDCKRSSNTPQFSLSGLSQYLGPSSLTTENHTLYRNSTDKLRRSMPNLLRSPSMPSVPSSPCLASPLNPPSHGPSSLPMISSLRSSQSFDSSSGLARLQSSIPSPGQLTQRVQSVGNFPTTPRNPVKATAYVSPTVQQCPPTSSLPTSTSLHSIPSCTALPQLLKHSSSFVQQPLKASSNQPAVIRSSLPRPASFVGASGVPRASKITQPTRSMLTPPKSVAALSALRDSSWKDGCY
ncbi:SLAIN motif-containing protein 1a isoform X2 [Pseudochaenichthys georgianus]|uniref:SLAIN motif-containing protein 1a isoform X2 n=2 Tax=Pseudochaenichthys georgianus TaxID=52239 RepID=UPI00146AE6D8|nr:SLAIN motif-containing protein 1a isoform X2 [Pseudochaenichthys georgianus]